MKLNMTSRQIEISIIICTYNTKKLTIECLNRLKKSIDFLNKPVEVIVVENGHDGTGDEIKKKYSWVKVINPKENTGFAKGNNLGIKASNKNSKYYLFLNTDVLVYENTLLQSINYMQKNIECSVLGCKLRLGDNSLQYSAGYLPTPLSVFNWILGIDLIPVIFTFLPQIHPKYKDFFKNDRRVGWVMGAFLFTRGDVIATTKGFDENFFMYMEEVEWCRRINDAGYEIWYTPSFEVTHLDKASSKKDKLKVQKIFSLEILGVIYYLKKYYSKYINWMIPVIKAGLYCRVLAFFILRNKMRYMAYIETVKKI